MADVVEYLAIAKDRVGKVEDVALCNSYSLATQYANRFAMMAPSDAIISVYECKALAVYRGRMETVSIEQTER